MNQIKMRAAARGSQWPTVGDRHCGTVTASVKVGQAALRAQLGCQWVFLRLPVNYHFKLLITY